VFVRFRKQPNDGFRPKAAAYKQAFIACKYGGRCGISCPLKPRCRWFIGEEDRLQPYRLKVVLVENRRVDGKVKQETVAVLGSIDAGWLADFWEGIDPKLKCEDWELNSLRARTAFWEGANQRLKQLANRLGPDVKRIRIAAHKRVPYPKEPERKQLELLEAKHEFDFWDRQHKSSLSMIQSEKRAKKSLEENIARDEAFAQREAVTAASAARKLIELSVKNK
jgi:hypothetical protein